MGMGLVGLMVVVVVKVFGVSIIIVIDLELLCFEVVKWMGVIYVINIRE